MKTADTGQRPTCKGSELDARKSPLPTTCEGQHLTWLHSFFSLAPLSPTPTRQTQPIRSPLYSSINVGKSVESTRECLMMEEPRGDNKGLEQPCCQSLKEAPFHPPVHSFLSLINLLALFLFRSHSLLELPWRARTIPPAR